MNILISGSNRSGKTLLLELLADNYRKQGCNVIKVDESNLIIKKPNRRLKYEFLKSCFSRKGDLQKHFIMTIQHPDYLDIEPYEPRKFFDYYISTQRCR